MGCVRRRVTRCPRLAVVLLAWMSSTGCAPDSVEAPAPDCPPARLAEILQQLPATPSAARPQGLRPQQPLKPALPSDREDWEPLRRPPLNLPVLAVDDPHRLRCEAVVDEWEESLAGATLAPLPWQHPFAHRLNANTWLDDAMTAPPARARLQLRRAARLGRLLILATADVNQEIGLEILAAVVAIDPNALESAGVPSLRPEILEGALAAQREAIRSTRGRSVDLYCRLVVRLDPWWQRIGEGGGRLTEEEVAWLHETASCGGWRAMRIDTLGPLRALAELGRGSRRTEARSLLERLTHDPDPIVAAEARRLLDYADAITPCIPLIGG